MPNLWLKFILKNGFDTKKMGGLESSVHKDNWGPTDFCQRRRSPRLGLLSQGWGPDRSHTHLLPQQNRDLMNYRICPLYSKN